MTTEKSLMRLFEFRDDIEWLYLESFDTIRKNLGDMILMLINDIEWLYLESFQYHHETHPSFNNLINVVIDPPIDIDIWPAVVSKQPRAIKFL